MIGVIFTTSEEATALANLYSNGRVDAPTAERPVQVGPFVMGVAGPGKINAALATERLLRDRSDLDALVHAGACTPLSEDFATGTLVGVSSVLEGDRVVLDNPAYPQMPLALPFDIPAEGVLVSQDHSSSDGDNQNYWARLADVRDETGYAVAFVAGQHGVPCHIVKVVGDELSAVDPQALQETMGPLLKRITAALQSDS